MTARWLVVALLALSYATAALVALTFIFAGSWTYEEIARVHRYGSLRHDPGACPPQRVTAPQVRGPLCEPRAAMHRVTLAYVLGEPLPPPDSDLVRRFYERDETSHLDDVRSVLAGARAVAIAAAAIAFVVSVTAWRGSGGAFARRLLRDALATAAIGLLLIGTAAAVAFEPLFLAFHQVFFPQGNFLFDPATSDLLDLYPHSYWYGVTLRIAASFVILSVTLAALLSGHAAASRSLDSAGS